MVFSVTQAGELQKVSLDQPSGIAGGTMPSKFSSKMMLQGVATGGGDDDGVAVGVGEGTPAQLP